MGELAQARFEGLRGPRLDVRRLAAEDVEPLFGALWDPEAWPVRIRGMRGREDFVRYLGWFLAEQAAGRMVAVVATDRASGERVALSAFYNASPGPTKVEIGHSWVATPWRRTHVNTEFKTLLLAHAFEAWRVRRVEFFVNPINGPSNRAMARLGVRLEGTLRKLRWVEGLDGGDRNVYGATDDDWPALRERLASLAAPRG